MIGSHCGNRWLRQIVRALAACAALGITAEAGDPPHRTFRPVPSTYAAPPIAAAARVPAPTAAQRPYLGTFRPNPALIVTNGVGSTVGFAPAGNPSQSAAMSLYGPFSRLRPIPREVVTYSRGYDGVLRPSSVGLAYEYPDPRLYRDLTLVPTGYRVEPGRGLTSRARFGRYLLGQK